MTGSLLAILSYHKVGSPGSNGWNTWYYVPEATFVRHLEHLRSRGWQPIDSAAFLKGLKDPTALPRRAALLTFDDAYCSVARIALPHLLDFGFPGVVFVPTRYIGGTNEFDLESHQPQESICSWSELELLERHGVSAQSHGASHRAFSDLSIAEIEQELVQSKATLEDRLGTPVDLFAFPYGDRGVAADVVRIALERYGYKAACLYGGGPLSLPVGDRYQLARLAIGRDTDLAAELPG
ncbi:MAG: polysaccharide deacetylase family protein [Actinomycetota bacterium]